MNIDTKEDGYEGFSIETPQDLAEKENKTTTIKHGKVTSGMVKVTELKDVFRFKIISDNKSSVFDMSFDQFAKLSYKLFTTSGIKRFEGYFQEAERQKNYEQKIEEFNKKEYK